MESGGALDWPRAAFEALHARVGACRPGPGFAFVENALRGEWIMSCEKGDLRLAITLAPTSPPTVQFLDASVAPPTPAVRGKVCTP